MDNSIAIIIPYFGKLPWYFNYFIHSCKYNLSVHFFIITDDISFDKKVSANIFIIHKSFVEVQHIISKKMQMDVAFEYAYKLCDFKPTYGFIFSDLVEGYDFWGYGDIDMIFGSIRNFITDEIMNEYDVISLRHDYLTGNFCLFRNKEKVNKLFMHSKDYKLVFGSAEHYCFDETNFHWDEFTEGKHYTEVKSQIESMTHVVKRLHEEKYIKAYFDYHVIEGVPGGIKWHKGIMSYKNKYEVIFYHLIIFKRMNKAPKPLKKIPDIFWISPTRIYI
jgi:hypothetical protein